MTEKIDWTDERCPTCKNTMRHLITSDLVCSEWYCEPCHKSYPMPAAQAEQIMRQMGTPKT